MARAFISYSRVDTAFTREFVDLLRDDLLPAPEHYVWYDRSLTGGQIWWDEILSQIAQADIFIYLLSNESVQSPYCQAEFHEAQRLQKLILTVQVRDRTQMSSELSAIQYVNMKDGVNDGVGIRQLARALRFLEAKIPPTPPTPKWQPATPQPNTTPEPPKSVSTAPVETAMLQAAAMPSVHSAMSDDEKESERLMERARQHNHFGNYDFALEDATAAIRLNPRNANAYAQRAWAHDEKRDYNAAIRDSTQALTLSSTLALAYLSRGFAYQEKQEYDRAIADYDAALALEPKYTLAYNNRGWSYSFKQEYDRAIADYTEAIAIDSQYARAYHNRGAAYYYCQRYDSALADFDKVLSLAPNAAAYQWRAAILRMLGRFAEADADERNAQSGV